MKSEVYSKWKPEMRRKQRTALIHHILDLGHDEEIQTVARRLVGETIAPPPTAAVGRTDTAGGIDRLHHLSIEKYAQHYAQKHTSTWSCVMETTDQKILN